MFGALILETYDFLSLAGPVVGGPQLALAVESLICSGATRIGFLGAGGALNYPQKTCDVGDVVFPRGALSEDTVARHFVSSAEIAFELSAFQKELEAEVRTFVDPTIIFQGAIWSTDAPYQETTAKVAEYQQQGAVLVEMEFAPLVALCSSYGVECGAIFAVSDTVGQEWTPGFRDKRFKATTRLLTQAYINLLAHAHPPAEKSVS